MAEGKEDFIRIINLFNHELKNVLKSRIGGD